MADITKRKIGKADIQFWDGGATDTFTGLTSTGRTITLDDIDWMGVDVEGWYGAQTWAGVTAAIAAIGAIRKAKIWLAPGDWTMDAHTTFTSNITLECAPGAVIILGVYNLTINGPFEAPLCQVFSQVSTGVVAFGAGAVAQVYPQWWGAIGDGVTNDTAAIQDAFDCAEASNVSEDAGTIYTIENSYPIINMGGGLNWLMPSSIGVPKFFRCDMSGSVIDATGNAGYVFAPKAAGDFNVCWFYGGTIKKATKVFNISPGNLAGSKVVIENLRVQNVSSVVADIDAQSSTVIFKNCRFANVEKVVNNNTCDNLIFEDLQLIAYGLDTNEQCLFENYGRLTMYRMFATPLPRVGAPVHTAWINNRYSQTVYDAGGRTGVVNCIDCRFGGENGSMTAVNNYATPRTTALGSVVRIIGGVAPRGSDTDSTYKGAVRLWDVPNILEIKGVDGIVGDLTSNATGVAFAPATNRIKIITEGNNGSTDGTSNYVAYIPPELTRYANKDACIYADIVTGNINASYCRGSTITNEGIAAATSVYHVLPAAKERMEITFANVVSGSGFVEVESADNEEIVGAAESALIKYIRLLYGQSRTLYCHMDGIWTLDGAPIPIHVNTTNNSPTSLWQLTLTDETAYLVEAKIIGQKSDGSARALYHKIVLAYRDAAGNATLQGAVGDTSAEVESDASWVCTFDVNANMVRLRVTGVAATTIHWSAELNVIKVVGTT